MKKRAIRALLVLFAAATLVSATWLLSCSEQNLIGKAVVSIDAARITNRFQHPVPFNWIESEYRVKFPDRTLAAEVLMLTPNGKHFPAGKVVILAVDKDGIVQWQAVGIP